MRVLTALRKGAALLAPFIGVILIVVAIWVLLRQLDDYSYSDVIAQLESTPGRAVLLALIFSAGAYGVLVGYDALALAYVGRRVPLRRIALGSFVAHSMSHSLGFHMITAGSIRYRFWLSWGLPGADVARALAFASMSFLMGMVLVSGLVLLLEPPDTMALLRLPTQPLRVVGFLLVSGVAGFLIWMRVRSSPVRIGGLELELPKVRLALGHLLIAASDWVMAAAVAWVLLPGHHGVSFFHFLGIFLFALLVGAIGHVPGGVGVFETLVVLMLKPWLAPPEVLGPLILYRLIYYVLPFLIGLTLMLAHEATRPRRGPFSVAERAAHAFPALMSVAVSTSVFSVGTLILLSGAVRMNEARMSALASFIPLWGVEIAHLAAMLCGALLLLLAWLLQCRLAHAQRLAVLTLLVAAAASLLRGLVWEIVVVIAPVLLLLLSTRGFFHRGDPLSVVPRSVAWGTGVVTVLAFTIWLGFFSFKSVPYSTNLWLSMTLDGDLPRFLRSIVAVLVLSAGYTVLRSRTPPGDVPGDADRGAGRGGD